MTQTERTKMGEIQSFNEWFTGLEEGRQKVLREDKWMLAENAYNTLKNKIEARDKMIAEMVGVGKVYTKEEIMEIFDDNSDYTHGIGWAISKEDLENHL